MLSQERVNQQIAELRKRCDAPKAKDEVSHRFEKIRRYLHGEAPNAIGAGQAFDAVSQALRFDLALAATDLSLTIAYIDTLALMISDLVIKKRGGALKIGNNYGMSRVLGMSVPSWQAAGWEDMARRFAFDIWTGYRAENTEQATVLFGSPDRTSWVNDHDNPYLVQKAAWFTTMTTVDPEIWRHYGYDPDADSLGPYWMLAQVWDDPEPAKVRNALQAVRDMNLGTTFIKDNPEGQRVYLVDEFLLLDDYDIRSVNMRRIAKGLAPVEVESYLSDPLPNAVLPFTRDDIFWPAYLKMCDELAAAPIRPDSTVEVRLDPETLRVERV
ncbi:hypothetical protein [Paracoccus zhejiangensis]|uniref:Uncharacterized protein n=1 Tax=Paracoccus zhejiangensis TaxID=1077935 RepID=A0A2H5F128_9RHOB|nr:hypothetical protein [Paracoccus zhejiangensis]AUH65254.1 hypothetical protein CX676_14680 [Paracoccus zhejiangensis]